MLYQTNALKNFCFTDSPLDREQKKQAIKQQAARLEKLQLLVKQSALPVIVLVEGWGTAGKGSRIASMIAPMDPRFFEVISVPSPTPEELAKPFLYRHMKNIPENGKFLFLDSGWMDQTIREYQSGSFSVKEYERRLEEICVFERQLCDNGYLLVKLFLHIGQEEQHKRIQHLLKHLLVLPRDADNCLHLRAALQLIDQRTHLDALRSSSENKHDFLHLAKILLSRISRFSSVAALKCHLQYNSIIVCFGSKINTPFAHENGYFTLIRAYLPCFPCECEAACPKR